MTQPARRAVRPTKKAPRPAQKPFKAETHFDRFFSLSLDFLCISSGDGYFKLVSPAVTDILGWSVKEFLAKPYIDFVHPDDQPATLREVQKQIRSGQKVLHFENRYRHKNGSWRVLSWRSAPYGKLMYATARDVTDVKNMEQALRKTNDVLEERVRERTVEVEKAYADLRLMLKNMLNAFIVWESVFDDRGKYVSFRFGYFNDAYVRISGVTPDVRGKDVFAVWPATEQSWVEVYGGVAMTGVPKIFDMYHAPTEGWYHCHAYRPTDSPAQVCVIFEEITERKKAEEEIRQLNADLERRVALRTTELEIANQELESFSYSVSHDLRAPLRHVQGYVEMLADDAHGKLSDKSLRYLKTITDASGEMGQLIDDLLAFSRMARAEMNETAVDLDALLRIVVDGVEMETKGRQIVWKIAPLPRVMGDPTMLKQVFANLIGNAVKYSRHKDPAVIEAGCAGEEAGRPVIFVRDNGAGFDMDYAHKLFGVFQRLHRAEEFEGTGIGLANVKRIINRHGGRVWGEGKVGQGAAFFVTLKPAVTTTP
jgi:PAS domain S-box-containing protein